jgi:hypothetical protein
MPNDLTGPVNVPNAAISIGRRCTGSAPAAHAIPIEHAANAPRTIFCFVVVTINSSFGIKLWDRARPTVARVLAKT